MRPNWIYSHLITKLRLAWYFAKASTFGIQIFSFLQLDVISSIETWNYHYEKVVNFLVATMVAPLSFSLIWIIYALIYTHRHNGMWKITVSRIHCQTFKSDTIWIGLRFLSESAASLEAISGVRSNCMQQNERNLSLKSSRGFDFKRFKPGIRELVIIYTVWPFVNP